MKEIVTSSLNVKFEKAEEYIHPEFTKVKVYIATYGVNRNRSNITKEAFIEALDSLKNIPLVGEFSEHIEDFKGHGGKLEITDEGMKYVQTTKPYGVIPESCNPRWEVTNGEEYLVCDAIVWTGRYEEANKVLENTCNQSMEINLNDYELVDDIMVVNSFTFSSLCILGQDTEPCFQEARIVYSLDKDNFKHEFSLLLDEIKNIDSEKGGRSVEKNENVTVFTEENNNEVLETVTAEAEVSNEKLEAELVEESEEVNKEVMEAKSEEVEEVFEEETLEAEAEVEVETEVEATEESNVFNVTETEEYQELLTKYEDLTKQYEILENEKKDLENFKLEVEAKERNIKVEELFARFEDLQDVEEYSALKSNSDAYSLEELETKLFAMLGKKAFSLKTKNKAKKDTVKILIENNHHAETINDNYGGLFNKYLKK